MYSHPHLYIPAEGCEDALQQKMRASKRTASSAHRISIFITVILFIGVLGVLSFVDLNIPLLDAVFVGHNVDEKTFHTPRENSQGDLYLLGVGKADITGFVYHFEHQYLH